MGRRSVILSRWLRERRMKLRRDSFWTTSQAKTLRKFFKNSDLSCRRECLNRRDVVRGMAVRSLYSCDGGAQHAAGPARGPGPGLGPGKRKMARQNAG